MGMGADVILDPDDLDKSFATGPQLRHEALEHRPLPARPTSATEPVQPLERHRSRDRSRAPTQWILDRLDAAIAECDARSARCGRRAARLAGRARVARDERYAGLRLNEYAEAARRFVWNELADWYLESVKGRLDTPGADRDVARAVLVHVSTTRCACCIRSCRS